VYGGILYQVKQGTGDRGITAEIWKDFNEVTTNESASACGL